MTAYRLRRGYVLATLLLLPFAGPGAAQGQEAHVVPAALVGSQPDGTVAPARLGFLDRQLRYPRVKRAYERKSGRVDQVLEARGVEEMGEVFFRVFKREQELEVWVRETRADQYTLVTTYPVCQTSGRLGPKSRQGDLQIPEGFYTIDIFNPQSQYHLSMRVDYPNAVDRVRGHGGPLGGDIYIHGGCATIGCVPVTDEYIEEIYLLAASARDAGQTTIPVHIFPTRLDDAGLRWLAESYGTDYVDYGFWENLQDGYLAFQRSGLLPAIGYDGPRYTVLPTPQTPLGKPLADPDSARAAPSLAAPPAAPAAARLSTAGTTGS